jgi:hypothetical protein
LSQFLPDFGQRKAAISKIFFDFLDVALPLRYALNGFLRVTRHAAKTTLNPALQISALKTAFLAPTTESRFKSSLCVSLFWQTCKTDN